MLRQFDTLSDEVGSATPENLTSIIIGLGAYFFPVNELSNQNSVIRKPRVLKSRHYANCLVLLDEYLAVFPGAKISDKICVTELN